MMRSFIRPAVVGDALNLAPRMRLEDISEVMALNGLSPLEALTESLKASSQAYSTIHNEQVVLMCGVGPVPNHPELGCAWLLGSPEMSTVSRFFMRHSRAYVSLFHRHYPVLWNLVDARNMTHIRWLKWCGFEFIKLHEAVGPEQRPFYEVVHHEEEEAPEDGEGCLDR